MNTRDVRRLFAYDRWANGRILAAAQRLSAEEFTRELGASFGSVRGTLIHIMWGEKRWLQRWLDGSRLPDPAASEFTDVPSLEAAWQKLQLEREAFAASLTDERLQSNMDVKGHNFTLGELIQHVLNHSTYHRGQVVLLLRQLGNTPPATDYGFFLIETRETAA